ncbi:hypothetical protein AB1L88_15760 [Tautonia sp. JC769]|uniref:hypothetical protein n=1 Tax=Tautonia sp. JC769 TaxID=3232135 RepID=UPI0034591FFA
MDLAEELTLIRQRLDAMERQAAILEQPGDQALALVVSRASVPTNTDVARWTVNRVAFEETEGAAPTFTAGGSVLAPGIGGNRQGTYFVAVPVQRGRFVTVL